MYGRCIEDVIHNKQPAATSWKRKNPSNVNVLESLERKKTQKAFARNAVMPK